MAKKKRSNPAADGQNLRPDTAGSAAVKPLVEPAEFATKATAGLSRSGVKGQIASILALPGELGRGDWTAILLALLIFLSPAVAVPNELMLQDTLKSIVVSCIALFAAALLFWRQRNRRDGLRWHFVMWLFLALFAYAIGSMFWSHTFLAGVEAARWLVLSVVLWLGLNSLSRERIPMVVAGVHFGAVVATLWAGMQFWFNWTYIPQGPPPASSFVNRNFFAEFIACTIPFGVYLLLNAKNRATICLLAFTNGFIAVGIMMTGTRSAFIASGAAIIATLLWTILFRRALLVSKWDSAKRIMAVTIFLLTVTFLGLLKSETPGLEYIGINAWQRLVFRSSLLATGTEYTTGSASVRIVMWKSTGEIFKRRPFSGVGAGAWEADVPLYQPPGSQIEVDYYVHNEILQLLAEYGLVGWLMVLSMLAYLSLAFWKTVRNRSTEAAAEAPLRAMALSGLLAFLVVSNAGFPWRMASTGALFAISLAILAASDARLNYRGWFSASRLSWSPLTSQLAASVSALALATAIYISVKAAECEADIVNATKLALTISKSGNPNDPRFDKQKAEMLRLIKKGTDLNPHYRKITPMVADELARWGDWKNAIWVWESVLSSRPYVVAMMSNVARGAVQVGDTAKAEYWIERAKKIQPSAPSLTSIEAIVYMRTNRPAEALKVSKVAVAAGAYDFDMINAAYQIGVNAQDWQFAVTAAELRSKRWPQYRTEDYIRIGNLYIAKLQNETKAIEAYRTAIAAGVDDADRKRVAGLVPGALLPKVMATPIVVVRGSQTFTISGALTKLP